jgi:hypothetical protein
VTPHRPPARNRYRVQERRRARARPRPRCAAAVRAGEGARGGEGGACGPERRKAPSATRAKGASGSKKVGGVVLSHRVAPAVPSAQRGLTSEFGMGSGVALAPCPPTRMDRGKGSGCSVAPAWRVSASVGRFLRTGQAARALSTARLHVSPRFHLPPIYAVVFCGPSGGFTPREDSSWVGLPT